MTITNAPPRPIISTNCGADQCTGLGHCACGYCFQAVEIQSGCPICPQCDRDTWFQIEILLFLSGFSGFQSKDVVEKLPSLDRCTSTLIELLKPPPDKRFDCWVDIAYRWYLMLDVERRVGDEDQMRARKAASHEYIRISQMLQSVTRTVIAAGDLPLIAPHLADHMAEIAERHAAWTTTKPWFPEQVAVEHTCGLLYNWGHPLRVSRQSKWHRSAAALLGVKNEDVALTRHMRKVLKTGDIFRYMVRLASS
jgi:hypothetical protein